MHIVNISCWKFVIFIRLKLKLNRKCENSFFFGQTLSSFLGIACFFAIFHWLLMALTFRLHCSPQERKREAITHGNYPSLEIENLNISYRYVIFGGKIEKLLHFGGNWENLSTHFSQLPLNVNLNQLKCQLQQNMKT